MSKTVDSIFTDIAKDWKAIAIEATKNAAKKIQNDIVEEAEDYLYKYYNNYSPKLYNRTHKLRRAIVPYWAYKHTNSLISIEVGVQYKSSALKGAYRSNSQYHQSGDKWISRTQDNFNFDAGDNGIPEPDWILENFLKGEHGGYHQDKESTESLMQRFFDIQLPHIYSTYIKDELFNAIIKRL